MKQSHIFLGTQDIASLFGYYKKGYEKMGYKVTTCSFPNKYSHNQPKYDLLPDAFFLKNKFLKPFEYQLNPDENSKIQQTYLRFIFWLFFSILNVFIGILNFFLSFFLIFQKIHWIITIQKYDIFHFIWIQDYADELEWRFWWIKYFNKKLIVNFVGDDVRWSPLLIEEYQKLGFEYEKPEIFVEKVYTNNDYANEFLKR